MSAYIVSDATINLIVSWANAHVKGKVYLPVSKPWNTKKPDAHGYMNFDFSNIDDCQLVAQILLDENYRSVNYRYPDDKQLPHEIKFSFASGIFYQSRTMDAIKCCDCLDYQSCETDDWHETIASKLLMRIRETAVKKVLAKNGYDEAPWGL